MPTSHTRVETWIRDHGRLVRAYLVALVRRDDVADDLVQEVFRRAWQARDRYTDQGTPRAYLLRIADRLVCDRARREGREVTLDDSGWTAHEPVSWTEPEADLCRAEARAALFAALDLLSPAQRRVLLLRYFGSLSFSEIAATLDVPLGTVLSHCRRGLLTLRKVMSEDSV